MSRMFRDLKRFLFEYRYFSREKYEEEKRKIGCFGRRYVFEDDLVRMARTPLAL